ncbi:MAG: dockerin type I repeat-containing protein, partial [Ruminococcus sp.]
EMKRFIVFLSSVFAAVTMTASLCFAASVSIESAAQTSTGEIAVKCSITEPNAEQVITVIACESGDETYLNDIIYVNQFTADIAQDNTFSFNFLPADWTDTNKVYLVRVGGYGIDTPDSMLIAFYDGKTYIAGDIDASGTVDNIDAALLLRYLSGISDLTSPQIAAGDVNKDVSVDMIDVIEIINITKTAE